MKYKVKYTRQEYRNEYLKSEEWKSLRSLILSGRPDCQCCKKTQASDVHHLIYKNIIDVTINDLLPVCRNCHNYIHKAINDGFIPKHGSLENIKQKTLNILEDIDYLKFLEWAKQKYYLNEYELKCIFDDKTHCFLIRRISGLIKKKVTYDNIHEIKFTGRQIVKIRNLIKLAKKRRKQKIIQRGPCFKRCHIPLKNKKPPKY